jgi:hypothetical protein
MNIKFFHADGSSYFFLDRLLIVPFGYNYVDGKPSPVQFGECSLTGVFLKTNNNCAVIDLDNQSGLRLIDLPNLFPQKVDPITEPRFLSDRGPKYISAKKYYDYLIDFYIEQNNVETNKSPYEKIFLKFYFDLCYKNFKDEKNDFYKTGIEQLARQELVKYGYGGDNSYNYEDYKNYQFLLEQEIINTQELTPYPFNDGRVLFQVFLPLNSVRLSVAAKDLQTKLNINNFTPNNNYSYYSFNAVGYTSKENFIAKWEKNVQQNKNKVGFYEIDFLFWDGKEMRLVEIDGDKKDNIAKRENLTGHENVILENISNDSVKVMSNRFIEKRGLDNKLKEDILNFMSPRMMRFWENEDTSSLFKDLAPIGFFNNYTAHYTDVLPKEHFICIEKLPWNLKTNEGQYVILD